MVTSEDRAAVLSLLSRKWNIEVGLGEVETLREGRCYRVALAGAPVDSAIVKRIGTDAEPSPGFLDEWAGLAFLDETAPPGLAPRFYGGARSRWLTVCEDLGAGESVATALMGDDPDRAREALALHAEAVADLHAATWGKETRYRTIREGLGPANRPQGQGWGDLRNLREDLERSFGAIGQATTPTFWGEYEALVEAIDDPAPFRAYVHNDSCPDNTVLEGDRVRLIDFEVGGYHSALLDAAYARLSMPHCWLAQRLPDDVAPWVENRYRARLAPTIPQIMDDRLFGRRITEACAYWMVSNRTWRVHSNLEGDFQWGASTWWQRVLLRLERFAETTEEFDHLPEMGRAARETHRRLSERWEAEPMPFYYAFR